MLGASQGQPNHLTSAAQTTKADVSAISALTQLCQIHVVQA